jgi:hypothetical protein
MATAWTLKLDQFTHDLKIKGGKFERVRGADEVRQRVKVALWHYIEEYFLNIPNGVPWYEQILGRKSGAGIVSHILRRKILATPGVIRIVEFQTRFDSITRTYQLDAKIQVEGNKLDTITILPLSLNINQNGGITG